MNSTSTGRPGPGVPGSASPSGEARRRLSRRFVGDDWSADQLRGGRASHGPGLTAWPSARAASRRRPLSRRPHRPPRTQGVGAFGTWGWPDPPPLLTCDQMCTPMATKIRSTTNEQNPADVTENQTSQRHAVALLAGLADLAARHVAQDDRRDEADAGDELGHRRPGRRSPGRWWAARGPRYSVFRFTVMATLLAYARCDVVIASENRSSGSRPNLIVVLLIRSLQIGANNGRRACFP
jgi:hypothetical protein